MKNIAIAIFICLALLGGFFLCRGHASLQEDLYNLSFSASLNAEQRQYFVIQIDYHEAKAREYMKRAEESCWYLPNLSDRDKAKYCFTSAMAMAAPGTPMTKIVAAILVGLTNYGLDVLEETEITEQWLMTAEYHYELKEFFESVLING